MPIMHLQMSTSSDEVSLSLQSVVSGLTDLAQKHLRKDPMLTAITVQLLDTSQWFVHKQSLAELKKNSFYLDIKITEGVNNKDERSAFIDGVFAYMQAYLGNLHHESYVYIEEVKADAYGFGGKTQEYRYIHAQLTK